MLQKREISKSYGKLIGVRVNLTIIYNNEISNLIELKIDRNLNLVLFNKTNNNSL